MTKPPKLLFLESIRGVAAFVVVITHLMYVFAPVLKGDETTVMTHGTLVRLIAASPLSVFHNGGLAVQVFFMLSGIVLSLFYFREGKLSILTSAALRRYFRLMIPALASVLFAWIILKANGFHNLEATRVMGRIPDATFPHSNDLNFLAAIKLGAYRIFFDPDVSFAINDPLWTMPVELQGSFLIFAFLALIGQQTNRFIIYAILGISCYFTRQIFLIDFLVGVAICDVYVELEKRKLPVAFPLWLGIGALGLGLFLGGFKKAWLLNLVGLHPMVVDTGAAPVFALPKPGRIAVPAAFFIIASVMFCPALQRAFEARFLLFLGKISFSLYLFHLPVIHSFGCQLYLLLRADQVTHLYSTLVASFASIVLSLLVAWAGYYAFDRPSIQAGRAFETCLKCIKPLRW